MAGKTVHHPSIEGLKHEGLTDEEYQTHKALGWLDSEPSAEQPVEATPAPVPLEQPAGNAALEAWQEFARSKGATDADLEGKSRDDLRAQFGA